MPDPCGRSLHRQHQGAGPPVLLVHGLGASARYWDRVTAAIAARRTTIAPDLLGFGRSPTPNDASYDLACHVTALAPLLAPGTVVVGHSTGGIIAAGLAAAHPDLVTGILLVCLPAFPDQATARAEIGRVGLLARLTVQGRPAARILCEAACRLRPLVIATAPLVLRDLPRAVAADAARHTWTSYSRSLERVVIDHRVDHDLAAVKAPVHLLHGDADRTAPLEYVRALAAHLESRRTSCSLTVVEGDHHLPVRRPDVVADLIGTL